MENMQQPSATQNTTGTPAKSQAPYYVSGAASVPQMPYGAPYTTPYGGYYPYAPKQQEKKKLSTGLLVFIIVLSTVIVFGFGVLVSTLIKTGGSTDNAANSGNSASASEELDSLDKNALKPGVDSGNNDLIIRITPAEGKTLTTSQIAAKSANSVVGISVYGTDGILNGEASGVVAGTDSKKTKSYIITCAHVIEDAKDGVFKVVDQNGKEYLAAVLGYDLSCDVGVLSVEKTGFQAVSFGDSGKVKAGESVVAIGNPGGTEFYGSVTQGIVSATDRMLATSDNSISCIQHDAAISPGSSGGALFNSYGQVVGMNYSKIALTYYEGMNFAIPSRTVIEKANEIIAKGIKTRGAKIGMEYYVAASYLDENYKQLIIYSIDQKSDLYGKAEKGDFIIAVNGEKISDQYAIIKLINTKKAGDEISLTIARKNEKTGEYETKDIQVKLIEK